MAYFYRGVLIRVRLRFQSGSKAVIRFEVQDTGGGISPENQELLFQPFNQVSTGQAPRQEGTGLGLSICKDLAVNMGGQVGLESQASHGSTFWFEIPFKDVHHKKLAEITLPTPKGEMIVCLSQTPLLDQLIALYSSDLHFEARCSDEIDTELVSMIESRRAVVMIDMESRSDEAVASLVKQAKLAKAKHVVLLARAQLEELSPLLRDLEVDAILGSPFRREQLISVLQSSIESALSGRVLPQVAADAVLLPNAPLLLLVEDNQTNQLVAELILQGLGYRVHTVANGKEALEALERISYDVV